jgi:hypothetical protein
MESGARSPGRSVLVPGALRVILHIMGRHPLRAAGATLRGKSVRAVNTPQAVRENFYSAATPEADIARYTALLDEEYVGRNSFDLTMLSLPKPERVTTRSARLGSRI